MKNIIKAVALSSLLCSTLVYAETGESKLTKWASKTTAKIIGGTKDVMAGIQKGVDTGRQSGESLDGAVVITDGNYQDYVDISIESAQATENGYEITLVFKNKTDEIVRLTNLHQPHTFYLMDDQGFTTSTLLEGSIADITILKNASAKRQYVFSAQPLSGKVTKLYLYDKQINLS